MPRTKDKDYISLDYDRVVHETYEGEVDQGAVLLAFGDEEVWIPKSTIDPEFFPLEITGGEVAVEFWMVQQKELEDYES